MIVFAWDCISTYSALADDRSAQLLARSIRSDNIEGSVKSGLIRRCCRRRINGVLLLQMAANPLDPLMEPRWSGEPKLMLSSPSEHPGGECERNELASAS